MARLQPASDTSQHEPASRVSDAATKRKTPSKGPLELPRSSPSEFRVIDESVREARARRRLDTAWENRALHKLASCVSEEPHAVLQSLLSLALELCGGGADSSTSGVSLLETAADGTQQFRWVALAGRLADHVGGTTPRDFSPCGACLDRGMPTLFARPDLKFTYFLDSGIEFTEGLVLPFVAGNSEPIGTLWVVSHPPARHVFDSEDVRLMESLGRFAASAFVLARDRDAAERKSRVYQDGLASVSHDLRTPLHTISGYVDLLSMEVQGPINDDQSKSLSKIRKTQKFLCGVVGSLLEYARIDAGAEMLKIVPISLEDSVRSAFDLASPQMKLGDISFYCESVVGSACVLADSVRLEQVLLNLLGNAGKFTPNGGRVVLAARVEGERAFISVSDNGRGIPSTSIESIFDPFVQLESGQGSTRSNGVGLGLAISRALAGLMQGEITVSSELGRGTAFTLSLPLA